MNLDITKLFPKKPRRPNVKVRFKTAMVYRATDGTSRTAEEGDEVELLYADYTNFEPGDLELLNAGDKKNEPVVPDPTPERPATLPAPEAWKNLPPCFTEFHDLTEKCRVASEHIDLIHAKRLEVFNGVNLRLGAGEVAPEIRARG